MPPLLRKNGRKPRVEPRVETGPTMGNAIGRPLKRVARSPRMETRFNSRPRRVEGLTSRRCGRGPPCPSPWALNSAALRDRKSKLTCSLRAAARLTASSVTSACASLLVETVYRVGLAAGRRLSAVEFCRPLLYRRPPLVVAIAGRPRQTKPPNKTQTRRATGRAREFWQVAIHEKPTPF